MADEIKINSLAAIMVNSEDDTPVVSPIGYVKVDIAAARNIRLFPCYLNVTKFSLNGGDTDIIEFSDVGDALFFIHVEFPNIISRCFNAAAKLPSAIIAFV